jgi:hypothetical protein
MYKNMREGVGIVRHLIGWERFISDMAAEMLKFGGLWVDGAEHF